MSSYFKEVTKMTDYNGYNRRILTPENHTYLNKYENLDKYLTNASAKAQFHRRIKARCTDAIKELQKVATQLPPKYRRKTFVKSETLELLKAILKVESSDSEEAGIIKDEELFRFAVDVAIVALNCADVLIDSKLRMAISGTTLRLFQDSSRLNLLTTLYYYPHIL